VEIYEVVAGKGTGLTGAHIAKDGSILRYAEKATGGEAFVPRNGDEGRSLGILRTAADWYGASVVPKQMGAMFHGGTSPSAVSGPGGGGVTVLPAPVQVTLAADGQGLMNFIRYQVRRLGGPDKAFG
jgi:hypothetical protein